MSGILSGCPVPIENRGRVEMAHGGGGSKMQQLIEEILLPAFGNPEGAARHDSALLQVEKIQLAFTTDSYVVRPLFFQGGSIGSLAVNGTVNDLSMSGAYPVAISAGLILEEGLPLEHLQAVVSDMQTAARTAGVRIVTGDTKVVERGRCDGMYINTAGVGIVRDGVDIGPHRVQPGDAVILSGDIGRHGIAILAAREDMLDYCDTASDCAPLNSAVTILLNSGAEVHCLRDLTRGGMASVLVEIAQASGTFIHLREEAIPVSASVRAACELLGYDPLYIANEGRFVAFVPAADAETALKAIRTASVSGEAKIVGTVQKRETAGVSICSKYGTERHIYMLSGEQLPRIC